MDQKGNPTSEGECIFIPREINNCYFRLNMVLLRIRLLEAEKLWSQSSDFKLKLCLLIQLRVICVCVGKVGKIEFTATMGKIYWFLLLNWNLTNTSLHITEATDWRPAERSQWRLLTRFWGREKSEQPVHLWYVRVVPKQGGRWLFCPWKQILWNFCG